MLRLGRSIDTIQGALKVMSTISDDVIRITSALSRISNSCFMVIDNVVCLQKLGVLSPTCVDASYWDRTSTRFWLYSIMLSLFRDCYELSKIWQENKRVHKNTSAKSKQLNSSHSVTTVMVKCQNIVNFGKEHADVCIDLIKNIGDLTMALNSLKLTNFSTQFVALMGMISTTASAVAQMNPMLKMVPSL